MTAPYGFWLGMPQPQQPQPPALTPLPQYGPVSPGAVPGPYATYQPFGPNQNLIGTQINPAVSPDTAAARTGITQQYGALSDLPNRQALAEQSYNALANLDTANFGKDIQGLGQRAAQFGRLGSGAVTSEAGDIFGQHAANLANIKAQLASSTAGQEFADQLAKLNAAQGVTGQLAGLDQTAYQNLLGERGYQSGLSQQAYENALQGAGLTQPNPLATAIGGQYGQQAQNAYGSTGALLQQLLQQYARQPYAGTAGTGAGGWTLGGQGGDTYRSTPQTV